MKTVIRRAARLDPGYLIVIGLCLLAVWPFISQNSLPQDTDAELHIFRLAELSRLVRAGEIFPRWAPNFYFGYGYPIFNYYAPLVYYLGLGVDLLPYLGTVTAVKAVFILGIFLAGIGMYAFVRNNWGKGAGLVASALYVFSPYILYVDPHARGDLAESFSFGLFAITLWLIDVVRRQPSSPAFVGAVLALGMLITSHNLMALVFFALLLVWAIWQLALDRISYSETLPVRRKWIGELVYGRNRLLTILLLGAGIAAIFWLPVFLERDAVNLGNLVADAGHFNYSNHFISISELLAPPQRLDWGATEPAFQYSLGLAQWISAAAGVFFLLVTARQFGRQIGFFAVGLVTLLFLTTRSSMVIWDVVPLMPFLQFPWRLVGPASAMAAILGGFATFFLLGKVPDRFRSWLIPAVLSAVLFLAFPYLQVVPWEEDFGPTNAQRVLQIEMAGRWLGTTATADFVPATVLMLPDPEPAIVDQIMNGQPIDRVNRATLPSGTTVRTNVITPLRTSFDVNSAKDFRLRLFLFDFPGWKVLVDGQPHEKELGMPEGLIVIPVSASSHSVEVYFGLTGARSLGAAVSLLSLSVLIILSISGGQTGLKSETFPGKERNEHFLLVRAAATVLILGSLYVFVVDTTGILRYVSSGLVAEPAQFQAEANFGSQINLIGYDISDLEAQGGKTIEVTLYWKAQRQQEINYQVFLHLVDQDGFVVAQSDKLNPGDFPTRRWPVDRYVRDAHRLQLPENLLPGTYRLSAGLWVSEAGWRLPLLDANGDQIGDAYTLEETVQVK